MTARSERTRGAIKDALLGLLDGMPLGDVTMSSLAKAANISRSTLYDHYSNVREVFDECVLDFSSGLRSLGSQLHCGDCSSATDGSTRPFCVALRDAGKHSALVKDQAFLPTLLDAYAAQSQPVDAPGKEDNVKRALFLFQMSGCYSVAMDDQPGDDWAKVQKVLDAYIRAGVNATR
ncbi:MAG: TetR/AcrR family transcriptional regulator [Eggerthellaceae bacterium]|nr:TetR/AcrR family transcriptional regulator [Eggerthellaceae bacterium]